MIIIYYIDSLNAGGYTLTMQPAALVACKGIERKV